MNDVQAAASFTKRVYNSHINCNFPARIWQSDDQNNKNESRHWRYQDHNFLPLLVLICQETSSDQDSVGVWAKCAISTKENSFCQV